MSNTDRPESAIAAYISGNLGVSQVQCEIMKTREQACVRLTLVNKYIVVRVIKNALSLKIFARLLVVLISRTQVIQTLTQGSRRIVPLNSDVNIAMVANSKLRDSRCLRSRPIWNLQAIIHSNPFSTPTPNHPTHRALEAEL